MKATLYMLEGSHPSQAARLMLEHKGIEPRLVKLDLLAGFHDVPLRVLGFRGRTVPAVVVDGRRVQGTREIARALDELVPGRPLLGGDPARRAAIEEAETWGHDVLQPVPRVIMRAAFVANPFARSWFVGYMGFPTAMAPATIPIGRRIAGWSKTGPEQATARIARLPELLDHVDALLHQGVIGGAELNAADAQIGTSLRFLLAIEDVRPIVEGRPAAAYARRVLPEYIGPIPEGVVPAGWLPAGT